MRAEANRVKAEALNEATRLRMEAESEADAVRSRARIDAERMRDEARLDVDRLDDVRTRPSPISDGWRRSCWRRSVRTAPMEIGPRGSRSAKAGTRFWTARRRWKINRTDVTDEEPEAVCDQLVCPRASRRCRSPLKASRQDGSGKPSERPGPTTRRTT